MDTNHIKWGISTIGCPALCLAEAAELGERTGYPLLEVRIAGKDFAEREVLRKLAAEKRCFILGSSFGLIHDDLEQREHYRFCALLAAEYGIPYVRIFGGGNYSEPMTDEKYDRAKRNLEFIDQLGLPVQPALESHDCFSSAGRISDLFAHLGCTLPVIWDTYHTCFSGKETLRTSWDLLSQYIIDIHIKDGNGLRHALPGNGEFPLTELFSLLREKNYSGMITCEHEKMWRPELPELPEVLLALEPYRRDLES